jgi:uncharacterized protein YbaR (Trm112 family)
MRQRILELLVCPYCNQFLELDIFKKERNDFKLKNKVYCKNFCSLNKIKLKNKKKNKKIDCNICYNIEIVEGALKCDKCSRTFPIINSIPRLLKDEYIGELKKNYNDFFKRYESKFNLNQFNIKNDNRMIKIKKKTAKAFGKEWSDFNKIFKEYEQQFLTFIKPMKPKSFKGKLTIYYSAKYGAEVLGIDLSESVEEAFKVNKKLPFAHFVQADIYSLPFQKESFDLVYSIGVIHHLPAPEQAFRSLIDYIRKGGHIFVWVYGYENNYKLLYLINPIRKYITTKLPLPVVKFISFCLTIPFHILVKLVYRPLNRYNKELAERILPINQHWYQLSEFKFKHNFSVVFDHLLAPIANYYKGPEFEGWFIRAGLHDVKLNWCRKNSWGGLGQK